MTNALLHAFAPPAKPESDFVNIVRGEGSLVFDDTGKDYVDGLGSLWYCQVGHGRTEIIDAVADQMRKIEAYNTFDPFTNEPAARVAEMIVERSPFAEGRVFLGCSGSEAVDTALKLARQAMQRRGQPERQVVVRRTNGYHGTNFGGTSAQGIAPNREGWGDLVPHFVEVPNDDLEAMAQVFADQGDRIAAVISEPVQGAGGVFPPADGYLAGLRRLCDDHGALLIFDEVICGFGRTGEWFGAQTFGVTPDLITFAKAVTSGYQPLSGVLVSRAVAAEFEEPGFLLRTGYTYSGHPAACAAGIANLELMEAEDLVVRGRHVGEQLRNGLEALAGDGLIESWRGVGAVYAAELGRDSIPVRNEILANGVIVRPIGTCLAICPPLVITDDEVGRIIDTMAAALK
ncbi:MAG: aminotransferase class III-fold pyridoxal phosphate-dependent enzyme [Acidimicrobiales bacterium]|jgi:adenosylmethionine-8-amino-7-oxononanoate aminotransferase|nr:aminotransferase class III-fold pyridoxal phosphate-dependent enzyme [Acidimicrobiales bacterium]